MSSAQRIGRGDWTEGEMEKDKIGWGRKKIRSDGEGRSVQW